MASKDYFDRVANQWDAMREGFFSEAVREKALSMAGVKRGELAVDIGAGTGFITEGLIAKGARVIVVDQSQAMLVEIEKKFAANDGLDCRLGEAERLPIPDEAVDYAFSNMYLHHVEEPPKAIEE
ncbi:MAG: class I SAM-dependent methyltransferase, partial [Dehalococcoidia bacterium]